MKSHKTIILLILAMAALPAAVAASDILDGKKTVDLPVLDKLKKALAEYMSDKI